MYVYMYNCAFTYMYMYMYLYKCIYVALPVCFQPFKINQIYFACFSEVFGVTPDLTTQVGVHCALKVVAVPLTLSLLHHHLSPFLISSPLFFLPILPPGVLSA